MPGGRPPGSQNRRSKALAERLRQLYPDWDPIEQMARQAQDEEDPQLRLAAAKEVARYIYPALKSVEHTGSVGIATVATAALRELNDDAGE